MPNSDLRARLQICSGIAGLIKKHFIQPHLPKLWQVDDMLGVDAGWGLFGFFFFFFFDSCCPQAFSKKNRGTLFSAFHGMWCVVRNAWVVVPDF